MELIAFSEIVRKKIKDQNISLNELASIVGMTRPGIQKLLNNIESIKLITFLNICNQLKINAEDYISNNNFPTASSYDLIESNQLVYLIEVFTKNNISIEDICNFLSITNSELEEKVANKKINHKELISLCSFYQIPFELFFKEKYKSSYKNIKPLDFIKYRSIVEKGNNLEIYQNVLSSIKLILVDYFNTHISVCDAKTKVNINNIDYFEYSIKGNEPAYFPVTIISEETDIPLVFISNHPNYNTPTQHVIEELTQNIFGKFFHKNTMCVNDIIWIEVSYFTKDVINVALVKFNSDNEFKNPEWYSIRGVNDKEIKIDKARLLEFLNLD